MKWQIIGLYIILFLGLFQDSQAQHIDYNYPKRADYNDIFKYEDDVLRYLKLPNHLYSGAVLEDGIAILAKKNRHLELRFANIFIPFEYRLRFVGLSFKSVYFWNTVFEGEVRLKACHFDDVRILDCTFKNGFSFRNSEIDSIYIQKCEFNEELDFRWATFNFGKITLDNTYFTKRVDFSNALLPSYVDLTGSTFEGGIDFRYARSIGDSTKINLKQADIENVSMSYTKFKIDLSRAEDSLSSDDKRSIYEQLLANQRETGFIDGYKRLDIEYNQFVYDDENRWLTDFIQKYWWNYGHSPGYIWIWTSLLLSIYWVINIFHFRYLMEHVYTIQFLRTDKKITILRPLVYTIILFFGLKMKIEELKPFNAASVWVFFIYITGIFCIAYLIKLLFQ